MVLPTKIIDPFTGRAASVPGLFGGTSEDAGVLTQTERFLQFNPEVHPFLNSTFGNAMNQNVAFGGSPELIFDGGSGGTEWTGTANAGTWNFADSGKVTITSADNSDSATFDDAGTIAMSGHTAITGKVDLDTYNAANNTITVQFGLAGVPLGNSVNLDDYIDTGSFSEQSFVIPKADLAIDDLTVDEVTITIFRTGGARPTIKFDDWQIEETGTPAVFIAADLTPEEGKRFHVTELRLGLADALSSTVSDGTALGLSYDKILGVSALTNGIVFQRVQKGKVLFSVTFRQLGDFLSSGSNIVNAISDGTNTFITLLVEFPEPIILDTGGDSFLSFTIADDLSGLLQFTATARGAVET